MSQWIEKIKLLASVLKKELVVPIEQASNLLAEHNIESFEDVESLVEQLDYNVNNIDGLPEKVGGFLDQDESGPYIAVNRDQNPIQREITIPHEIGHHILRHLKQVSLESGNQETQANLFACAIYLHSDKKVSIAEFEKQNPDVAELWWISAILISAFLISTDPHNQINIFQEK
jgi:Zn-dependent peptidase ImmA (M78 family)